MLPGAIIVTVLVFLSIYRSWRRRMAGQAQEVEYNADEEDSGTAGQVHTDRVASKRSRKARPATSTTKSARPQGRLSEWKKRNERELGIDSDSDETAGTATDCDDSGATTATCTEGSEYEYVEQSTSAMDTSDSGDKTDATEPPSYGKATSKTVRNRFLNMV